MTMQHYLDEIRHDLSLDWLVVVNHDGLTLCQSGIQEPLALAGILPSWLEISHQMSHALSFSEGMAAVCLMPKAADYLLLMRDMDCNHERLFLVIATKKVPAKSAQVLENICVTIRQHLEAKPA